MEIDKMTTFVKAAFVICILAGMAMGMGALLALWKYLTTV